MQIENEDANHAAFDMCIVKNKNVKGEPSSILEFEQQAISYWKSTGESHGSYEVLIEGSIRIIKKVGRGDE